MNEHVQTLVKTLLLFLSLLIITRINGKRQLSELSHFDYITGITIGTVAGSASVDDRLSAYSIIISIIVWSFIPIIIARINMKSICFKRLTGGKPIALIEHGIVNDENMSKVRYNIEDLFMQLRLKDIFNISEVEFALLETNGELSILKKSAYLNVTPWDLNISTPYKGLTLDLVTCGRINDANLRMTGKGKDWLLNELTLKNAPDLSEVIFAGLASDGNLQVIMKNNKKANEKNKQ